MINRCVPTAIFFVAILNCCTAKEITVTLQDGIDGYSGSRDVALLPQEPYRDRNLGVERRLMVSEAGASTLLHFDMTGVPGHYILKAVSVELYCISAKGPEAEAAAPWDVDISLVNGDWTEGTGSINGPPKQDGATFRRRSESEFWPYERVTASGGASLGKATLSRSGPKWYKWKLEGGFLGQPIGHSFVYSGFVLRYPPDQEKGTRSLAFASREYSDADKHPRMKLTLEVPDKPQVIVSPAPTPSSNPAPVAKDSAGILWTDFIADCGLKAQEVNEAKTEKVFRDKYEGKQVHWSGTIDSVREDPFGNGYLISVQMSPTESKLGGPDVTIAASNELHDRVLSLKSKDKISFRGRLKQQGGRILNHEIELEAID